MVQFQLGTALLSKKDLFIPGWLVVSHIMEVFGMLRHGSRRVWGFVLGCVMMSLLTVALPVQAEVRIAYVDVSRLMDESPQAKSVRQAMEREFAPRQMALQNEQKQIEDLEVRYRRESEVMKDADKKKLLADIRQRGQQLEAKGQAFRSDVQKRTSMELKRINDTIKTIMESMAKRKKLDLILVDGVAYATKDIDITDEVLAELNKSQP
jgi:outer membrane protein